MPAILRACLFALATVTLNALKTPIYENREHASPPGSVLRLVAARAG